MGYLASTRDPNPKTIKRFLTFLDCANFSPSLLSALEPHAAKHLLSSPYVCPSQFDLSLSLDCPDADTLFEHLFSTSKLEDLTLHKLKNEADYQLEKALIARHLLKFQQ